MNALAQKIGPAQAPTGNVDLQEAARFLRLLDAEADTWRFRTIRDRATKYHGTLESCADRLIADNATRCVFVAVNDGIGDKDEEMVRVRAVFADLDGAPLPESFDLEPHIIVQTSPGKWHVYWLVDGLPLELFKPVQRAIAKKYSSDPAVCDLPRIMRLPGFLHRKAEPFRSHIIHESGGLPYDAAQVLDVSCSARRTSHERRDYTERGQRPHAWRLGYKHHRRGRLARQHSRWWGWHGGRRHAACACCWNPARDCRAVTTSCVRSGRLEKAVRRYPARCSRCTRKSEARTRAIGCS